MNKFLFWLFAFIISGIFTVPFAGVNANESASPRKDEDIHVAQLHFFYSETCPHCHAEQKFLDRMGEKYSDLTVKRYNVGDPSTKMTRERYLQQYNVPKNQWGLVPLTFVGNEYFVGFAENPTGKDIEKVVQKELGLSDEKLSGEYVVSLPFVGTIDMQEYSFASLAVLLGFLDGFNVCSLGALAMVLGLALALKSRKRILLFGGAFIIVTASVYGFLIVLWYQLFSVLEPYIRAFELVLGIIGLAGGIFFLREFWRFQKYGIACGSSGSQIISSVSQKLSRAVSARGAFAAIVGLVALFAAVVAIVEFPCSAAIPVLFAGMLVEAGIHGGAYIGYIGLFVFMYLLDELMLFAAAVWTMKLKIGSPKITAGVVLLEALILLAFGGWYLIGAY